MSTRVFFCGSALSALCTVGLASPAFAQEQRSIDEPDVEDGATAPASADTSGNTTTRRSFGPEDFARFAPRSALDMARQVPGFSIQEGDGARGLGQADTNVLINGRRISGKSNGPVAALQRIPTEEVLRLELVDGASLDIGGLSGQVLNVITASTGTISGQFRYAPQFRTRGTPARLYEGSVAIAGGGQKDDWTLALENDSNRRGDDGPELVFDGDGLLTEIREERRNSDFDTIQLSGSYSRVADNGNVLNLTGEVNGFLRRGIEISDRVPQNGDTPNVRTFRDSEDEFNFEIGADYQFQFGPGRLKLIGYHRYEDSPTVDSSITEFADGRPLEGFRFERDADEAETIVRSEYSLDGLGGNLVFALEGVRNFLEIESSLQQRDATGELVPTPLAGANARVDEDRVDGGITYGKVLKPGLQLQTSIGAEYSQISQSGPFGQTREFWRPKGFVSLDWKASDALNLSGRIEREVGQLSFFDFIASVDLDQERENVSNANLVPEQSWVFEVEAAVNLGALGSLSLRPFFEEITDIVDQIPIEGGGQAPGNLPSAQRYGVESDLTLLSDGLGWRGTRLDVTFNAIGSSVRDPLLGFKRQLSGIETYNFESTLRHDFFGTSWAIGSEMFWEENAFDVRLDEIARQGETFAFTTAFIENKDVAGMTIRASASNILDRTNLFERTVFLDRSAGVIDFSEDRRRTFGTIFTLEIEGSF
ncbi:hypothetical protein AUC45_00120 [Erythrobacter sp. YT30]|nr:hypothetical protein AUC45_00120 [Erythrobacter sp. YT30]